MPDQGYRRVESWVARRDTQDGLRDLRGREAFINQFGTLAYIQRCVADRKVLPYPFSDMQRWESIAQDESCSRDWRAAAGWLLLQSENGTIGTWPEPMYR